MNSYYSLEELNSLGFKHLGKNVLISRKASIYDIGNISIDDRSRIDDFCVVSGNVSIGKNVHITPQCLIAGGKLGVVIENYSTLAYGVRIFSQTDDYSGITMANSTIPKKYKDERLSKVVVQQYSIIGAGTTIMPGCIIGTGCAVGANSLVLKSLKEWGIYAGSPVKRLKDRSKGLLDLLQQYEDEIKFSF